MTITLTRLESNFKWILSDIKAEKKGELLMEFKRKMSGTSVRCDIEPLFESGFVSLEDVMEKDLSQESMDFILDNWRFYRGERTEDNKSECIWWALIDHDTRCKLAVMENPKYSEYKREFNEHFGENWMKHYIRFNH